MPHDVVISYSRRNRDIADRFAGLLRERGLDVWYDRLIPTGADWRDEIARAIAGSKSLVVLFSHESNDSDELKKELAIADRRGLLIFPVRVEDVEPLGLFEYELTRRQWFNAFPDWQEQLPHVTEAIATGLSQQQEDNAPERAAKLEREPAALHAATASTSVASPPAGRLPWWRLAPYVLNLVLGLMPVYLPIWLVVQVFLTRSERTGRPRAGLVMVFAYMLPVAGLVCALGLLLGLGYSEITAPVAAFVIFAGLIIITLACLDHFLWDRSRALFWAWPTFGALVVAAGAIGFTDNYATYAQYQRYAREAEGAAASDYYGKSYRYSDEANRYILLIALGMTLANAAYLTEAWRRSKGTNI